MTYSRTAYGAKTLPSRYYASAEVFQAEQEQIFLTQWLCVGRAKQIAQVGDYFLTQVAGESLILVRDRQGVARGFYNVCRHRGTRLCTEPTGHFSHTIQCPYHAWTYGLDGQLLGAPNMQEVMQFNKADYPLPPVAVREWEGFLFINLASQPEPFEQIYAPILHKFADWQLPELVTVQQQVYEVAANWKLIFQNYSECYHCPTVHPVLNRLTPYRNAGNDLEEGLILGGPMRMSDKNGSMTLTGQRCATPLSSLSGDALCCVYYYTLFPTMFISLHPDYLLTHRLEPLAAERTRIICEWHFHPTAIAQTDFDPQPAVSFWDMTNRQDWHVCELSQQGISSRAYTPGPYAELESMLAAFDRAYLKLFGN